MDNVATTESTLRSDIGDVESCMNRIENLITEIAQAFNGPQPEADHLPILNPDGESVRDRVKMLGEQGNRLGDQLCRIAGGL